MRALRLAAMPLATASGLWACSPGGSSSSPAVRAIEPLVARRLEAALSRAAVRAPAAPSAPARTGPDPNGDEPGSIDAWPPGRYPVRLPGDRIYSKVRNLWVRPAPDHRTGAWLGYLSLGDSVRVKGGKAEAAFVGKAWGRDCHAWYAVEPQGYLCTGHDATLDPSDPVIAALTRTKADAGSPWPYRYGESRHAPLYTRPPSPEQQTYREQGLAAHLAKVARARQARTPAEVAAIDESFVGVDFSPAGRGVPPLPPLGPAARSLQSRIVIGSTVAYVDEFDHAGRSFLLTWDHSIIPKDKVRPYPASRFRGVVLGTGVDLPIAFFHRRDAPRYERRADGSFVATKQIWPRLAWTALTGKSELGAGVRYHETRAGGWCAGGDVAIARRAEELPPRLWGTRAGRRSWLDISILGGTLVAYEHTTPVYATLISPGRGGPPHEGVPTLETASTPLGQYNVLGKFLTATMVSGSISTLIHAEVPYTQNFSGPYALHGAYWHDSWGQLKSGGCVNLSPIDSRRIFTWTDPPLPEGWHGSRTVEFAGEKTLVYLHR